MTDQTSELLYMRAKLRLPGGVNSPVRAYQAVGRTPRFIQSAKGSHITDVDGNEMIDYVCSWGPGILGHADPRVIEKVKAACEEGLTFGAPTEREVEMAELLAQLVPSMEVSRLVSSGTEATMSAIRVARGYTKRDKIIKFRGCYHGHSDGLLVKAGSAALTTSVPDSAGVPADFTRHTLVAEYNSPDSVKALFEAYPDEIAAIIVEPVAANMGVVPPADGFLEFLREITKHYGALFIFDEVITGFRLALGGAGVFSYYAGFVHVWKDYRWRYAGRRVWWKRGYHAYGFPGRSGLSGRNTFRQSDCYGCRACHTSYSGGRYGYLYAAAGKYSDAGGCGAPCRRKPCACQSDRLSDEYFLHRRRCDRLRFCDNRGYQSICRLFWVYA